MDAQTVCWTLLSHFDKLSESTMPYLCTYCTLNKQYKEICSLNDTVETLTNRVAEIEAAYKFNVSQPATTQVMQSGIFTSVINKHSIASMLLYHPILVL